MNTINILLFKFKSDVGITHQPLPPQINAMPEMGRRSHLGIIDPFILATGYSIVKLPVLSIKRMWQSKSKEILWGPFPKIRTYIPSSNLYQMFHIPIPTTHKTSRLSTPPSSNPLALRPFGIILSNPFSAMVSWFRTVRDGNSFELIMMRPCFARMQGADFKVFERHVSKFLDKLPTARWQHNWSSTIVWNLGGRFHDRNRVWSILSWFE